MSKSFNNCSGTANVKRKLLKVEKKELSLKIFNIRVNFGITESRSCTILIKMDLKAYGRLFILSAL